MLAQQKRQEYLIEKQKKNKQKDLLETKKKRAEEKSIIEKNQIDRDAELAKKLQNLEETAESAEDFIPVVGRGKKKALSATLSKHSISKNDEISKSAIAKPETFAQPKTVALAITQPKAIALAVSQPKAVTRPTAQPATVAQPIIAAVAQSIAETVAQSTVIATDQPIVIATDQPTVITTVQPIAETVAQPIEAAVVQPIAAFVAQPAAVIVSQNPETDAIVAAQPQFVESKSVSQETLLEPVDLQETMTLQKFDQVSTQTANASFYQIPKEQVIDTDALNRYLQSMRSSVMHVRLWLQLAPRDRLFSHKKHVVMQDRLPYSLDLLRQHICPCTDQTLRIYSPWSLLISAFDKMVTETPAGASFTTLILNGCQSSIDDARVQMLSKIGKFIFNSVVNMAAYSLAETRTDNACSTCYLCHVAAPTRFCFVPEYVDAKHTIATRMIPMCNDEKCSHQLLEKVSDRSHSDKNAKFAGLRVFFNFDNSITVCESEDDVFKYTINQSSHMPPLPERISNADFAMQENSIILRDLNGHVFALPQAVAQKAYFLAQFMMADT